VRQVSSNERRDSSPHGSFIDDDVVERVVGAVGTWSP
jgi:hypothetical protein